MRLKHILSFTLLISVTTLFFSSCAIFKQGKEFKTFTECDFKVKNVRIVNLAGIDISNFNSIDDMALNDYLMLAQQAFSKEIDSELEIDIIAENFSDNTAAISGLDWQLFLKDELYTTGIIDKPVNINPHDNTVFTVKTNINLYAIIHSKSLPEILALLITKNQSFNLSDLDASIKVKPWYRNGSSIKKYPGFISISL
jgi:hypothetical protein